jgi:hypothetical protein
LEAKLMRPRLSCLFLAVLFAAGARSTEAQQFELTVQNIMR